MRLVGWEEDFAILYPYLNQFKNTTIYFKEFLPDLQIHSDLASWCKKIFYMIFEDCVESISSRI